MYIYDFVLKPQDSDLNVAKRFSMTNPGSYTITVKTRVAVPDTSGILRTFNLPPVQCPVVVK